LTSESYRTAQGRNSNQDFDNSMFRQKLDAIFTVKLDTTSDLKITVDGTIKNSQTNNNYLSSGFRENGISINNSNRTLSNDSDQKLFKSSLRRWRFKT
jgi:hypothetical protein